MSLEPLPFEGSGPGDRPKESWPPPKLSEEDWFSDEFIESRSDGRYRCLVCPLNVLEEWKVKRAMGKHQRLNSHIRAVESAKISKAETRVLYYPPENPSDPLEEGTAVPFNPQFVIDWAADPNLLEAVLASFSSAPGNPSTSVTVADEPMAGPPSQLSYQRTD